MRLVVKVSRENGSRPKEGALNHNKVSGLIRSAEQDKITGEMGSRSSNYH